MYSIRLWNELIVVAIHFHLKTKLHASMLFVALIPISHTDDSIKLWEKRNSNRNKQVKKKYKMSNIPLLWFFNEIWHGMNVSRSPFANFELQMLQIYFRETTPYILHSTIKSSNFIRIETSVNYHIRMCAIFVCQSVQCWFWEFLIFWPFFFSMSSVELMIGNEVRWCYCTFHRVGVSCRRMIIIIVITFLSVWIDKAISTWNVFHINPLTCRDMKWNINSVIHLMSPISSVFALSTVMRKTDATNVIIYSLKIWIYFFSAMNRMFRISNIFLDFMHSKYMNHCVEYYFCKQKFRIWFLRIENSQNCCEWQ